MIAGSLPSAWRWIQRKRAAEWPAADGRIDATAVSKPGFSPFSKRTPYRAELHYSYTCSGERYSGTLKHDLYSEEEAEAFTRGLEGQPVAIHYNPAKPSRSTLLESDLQLLQQNRPPEKSSEIGTTRNLFSEWSQPVLLFFAALSCIGLVLSLWVHIGALMGRRVAPEPFFWGLHVGIFIVWIPAVFVSKRLVGSVNRRDFWKVVLRGCPDWVRYMVYGFFGYAFLNFALFFSQAPSGKGESNPPAIVWRGFSGHWMVFYSAAFAILFSAIQLGRNRGTFANGESISLYQPRCSRCGKLLAECHCYTFSR